MALFQIHKCGFMEIFFIKIMRSIWAWNEYSWTKYIFSLNYMHLWNVPSQSCRSHRWVHCHCHQKALENAKNAGISNQESLNLIEAQAYPHFLDIMAILFLVNVLIMLLIGKLSPRKDNFVQKYTKQVDITPWKYVKFSGIIVCLTVILTYIYFK